MTKVQVPLLLVLGYLLLCLIYPKAWVGFDWNPASVIATPTGLSVLNTDSHVLWSRDCGCKSIEKNSVPSVGSQATLFDLDKDGYNEVLFMPKIVSTIPCSSNAMIFAYDDNGDTLFSRICLNIGEFPGDTSAFEAFQSDVIHVVEVRGVPVIITREYKSYPATRTHFRFWTGNGKCIGWYINTAQWGGSSDFFAVIDDSLLAILTYNDEIRPRCMASDTTGRWVGQGALVVLDPFSCLGVSPISLKPPFFNEKAKRGRQIHYLLFPRSAINVAICKDGGTSYNSPERLAVEANHRLRVDIDESSKRGQAELSYFLDSNFRVQLVRLSDGYNNMKADLAERGRLAGISCPLDSQSLASEVTYWTDSGWVSEGALRNTQGK